MGGRRALAPDHARGRAHFGLAPGFRILASRGHEQPQPSRAPGQVQEDVELGAAPVIAGPSSARAARHGRSNCWSGQGAMGEDSRNPSTRPMTQLALGSISEAASHEIRLPARVRPRACRDEARERAGLLASAPASASRSGSQRLRRDFTSQLRLGGRRKPSAGRARSPLRRSSCKFLHGPGTKIVSKFTEMPRGVSWPVWCQRS